MNTPQHTVFLERRVYRQRRLTDAARLLPVAGVIMFLFPMLWSKGAGTSSGTIYLFTTWLILIVAAFLVARRIPLRDPDAPKPDMDGNEGG